MSYKLWKQTKAADATGGTGTFYLPTANAIADYAYIYKYDNRNRCTEKKLPGADWIFSVYDKANLVTMQTNMNNNTVGYEGLPNEQRIAFDVRLYIRWVFRYDGLNRMTDAIYSRAGSSANYNELLSYDKQGNISSMSRCGAIRAIWWSLSTSIPEATNTAMTRTGEWLRI